MWWSHVGLSSSRVGLAFVVCYGSGAWPHPAFCCSSKGVAFVECCGASAAGVGVPSVCGSVFVVAADADRVGPACCGSCCRMLRFPAADWPCRVAGSLAVPLILLSGSSKNAVSQCAVCRRAPGSLPLSCVPSVSTGPPVAARPCGGQCGYLVIAPSPPLPSGLCKEMSRPARGSAAPCVRWLDEV